MRPVPIPESLVWEGGERRVMSAPDGDLLNPDIAPVEVIVDWPVMGGDRVPCFNVRCALDSGDLAKLAEGGHVWISFYGQFPPFSVDVTGPNGR